MTKIARHSQVVGAAISLMQFIGAALLLCCALSVPTLAEDAPLEIAGAKTLEYRGVIDLISTTPGLVIVTIESKRISTAVILKAPSILLIRT
jgi:hypothetical protein